MWAHYDSCILGCSYRLGKVTGTIITLVQAAAFLLSCFVMSNENKYFIKRFAAGKNGEINQFTMILHASY